MRLAQCAPGAAYAFPELYTPLHSTQAFGVGFATASAIAVYTMNAQLQAGLETIAQQVNILGKCCCSRHPALVRVTDAAPDASPLCAQSGKFESRLSKLEKTA